VVVVWLVCVAILRRSCGVHTRRSCHGVYSGYVEYTRWSCPYYAGTTVVSVT